MGALPVLLKPQRLFLVGAGKVGLHKAKVLADNGIGATVIAEHVDPAFEVLPIHRIICKRFEAGDVIGADIVIDASGEVQVAAALLEAKKRHGFLLNVVDVPSLCDFYFCSLLNYGDLKIAVSTNGASPTLAQCVRERIGRMLPKSLGTYAAFKHKERAAGIIDPAATRREVNRKLAKISLVGCGIGDAELLTLRAYRRIKEADVVLYDHLVTQEILDLIDPGAERIYVGKRKGCSSHTQAQINAMIEQYASAGLQIARLKSGDPYIFGRGAEEAQYLMERGFAVEVIGGLSSAIAGPSSAGIAVTARGYATNFSVVSAHLEGARVNLEWIDLLKIPNHTTTVLMGLSLAETIETAALSAGVNPLLDVAIISNASRSNQQTRITTLGSLAKSAQSALSPAIMVFGDVVRLHTILPRFQEN